MEYHPQMIEGCKPYTCKSGIQRKDTAMVRGKCQAQNGGYMTVSDGSRFPVNLLEFIRDKEKIHPTQKPVALIQYLIRTYSNEGDTILDNCMGSGTTAIAAIREKRNFISFEKSEEYWRKSMERIRNELSQQTLF